MTRIASVMDVSQFHARARGMRASAVRFGQTPYADLFQKVTLTPAEEPVVKDILALAQAKTLDDLHALMPVLSEPAYESLAEAKGRAMFHTPFTDLFIALPDTGSRLAMIDALFENVLDRPDTTTQQNTVNTLADLYFYALKPQDANPGPSVVWQKPAQLSPLPDNNALRDYLLGRLQTMETDPGLPLGLRRYIWKRVRDRLDLVQGFRPIFPMAISDQTYEATRRDIAPILAVNLPLPQPRCVNRKAVEKLQAALLNHDPAPLQAMSKSGEIALLIPEWARATGPDNTQHGGQAYTLDEHMLHTVAFTKASPFYTALSEKEKRLVTLAALMHDLGKRTGPANLQPIIPPDRGHPVKSADTAWLDLPSLGFSTKDTRTIARLLEFHQLLGNTIQRTRAMKEAIPPGDVLDYAVQSLKTPSILRMLCALTEGDVRSLSLDQRQFDSIVSEKMAQYSKIIDGRMQRNWLLKGSVWAQNAVDWVSDQANKIRTDLQSFDVDLAELPRLLPT